MFNTENSPQRTAMREQVLAGDQAWRETVAARWGAFQVMLADRTATTLADHKKNAAMDTEKGRAYIAEQEIRLSERRHMAKGYISGDVLLRDPVEAEVTMRIYEQAANPRPKD